uniref:C1q domain-containing protein n=1 Tax=Scleropages formosus TaxID=113540 RepID=A0A8C9TUH5_SCLFO
SLISREAPAHLCFSSSPGDKGDQGMMGPHGEAGPPGEPGECPDTCSTIEGPRGEQGAPGPVGPRGPEGMSPGSPGDKGEQGFQGPPGLNGQKGDIGEEGLPGPCSPTIQSAFSAALDVNYPMADQPVAFRRVLYNVQNNYNPDMGVYQAPVNGTYVFSYNLAVFGRPLKVGLYANFRPVARSTSLSDNVGVSQLMVLHLAPKWSWNKSVPPLASCLPWNSSPARSLWLHPPQPPPPRSCSQLRS